MAFKELIVIKKSLKLVHHPRYLQNHKEGELFIALFGKKHFQSGESKRLDFMVKMCQYSSLFRLC